MDGTARLVGRPRQGRGHGLIVGAMLITMAASALAVKARAAMRGQTVPQLGRATFGVPGNLFLGSTLAANG